MKNRRQLGFSLIELTMVLVIVAIASVPIFGRFTQVASSTIINEEIQTASQLAQERAEDILALRRNQGYAAVLPGTTNDVMTGRFASFSRSLTVTETNTSSSCPAGAACKSVEISVDRGSGRRASLVYVLVNY